MRVGMRGMPFAAVLRGTHVCGAVVPSCWLATSVGLWDLFLFQCLGVANWGSCVRDGVGGEPRGRCDSCRGAVGVVGRVVLARRVSSSGVPCDATPPGQGGERAIANSCAGGASPGEGCEGDTC